MSPRTDRPWGDTASLANDRADERRGTGPGPNVPPVQRDGVDVSDDPLYAPIVRAMMADPHLDRPYLVRDENGDLFVGDARLRFVIPLGLYQQSRALQAAHAPRVVGAR